MESLLKESCTSLDAAAARGDFDIGLSGIEDSPVRRARLAVTTPYYEFREILTVRQADRNRFRTLEELRGRRVATLGATLAYDLLVAAQAEHGLAVVTYEDDVHPYSDLALGRVDAVVLDYVLAERGVSRNAGLVNQEEVTWPQDRSRVDVTWGVGPVAVGIPTPPVLMNQPGGGERTGADLTAGDLGCLQRRGHYDHPMAV